jgi:hypothetical protein
MPSKTYVEQGLVRDFGPDKPDIMDNPSNHTPKSIPTALATLTPIKLERDYSRRRRGIPRPPKQLRAQLARVQRI